MKLSIPIVAGKTTCASEPGKMCNFARARIDGEFPVCRIFEKSLKAEDGWLLRLPECIAAEDKDDDPPNP